jgi:CheY-like chemotaxis protein
MAEQPLILVVDDEPDFREIFSAKLRAMRFRVETAENGKVALDKMANTKPDLVLMDVKMPVMDGATAVLKMKNDPALRDIKVVFLTNYGDPRSETREEVDEGYSREFGAHGYLKKTEDLDLLGEKIKGLLA